MNPLEKESLRKWSSVSLPRPVSGSQGSARGPSQPPGPPRPAAACAGAFSLRPVGARRYSTTLPPAMASPGRELWRDAHNSGGRGAGGGMRGACRAAAAARAGVRSGCSASWHSLARALRELGQAAVMRSPCSAERMQAGGTDLPIRFTDEYATIYRRRLNAAIADSVDAPRPSIGLEEARSMIEHTIRKREKDEIRTLHRTCRPRLKSVVRETAYRRPERQPRHRTL